MLNEQLVNALINTNFISFSVVVSRANKCQFI